MSAAVTRLEQPISGSLKVQPLQPTIGAEISGIDLRSSLSTELRDQIKATLLQYKVVFFRDQQLNRDQQIAFARQFGPVYTPPYAAAKPVNGAPGLHLIAATKELNERLAARKTEFWTGFHSDTNWRLVPSWGAVLRAVDLPAVGGDTIWVDAGLAYEGLPADVKTRLDGLFATVDFREELLKNGHDYPIVAHPVVRTHRETGNKILWVDLGKKPHIIGLDLAEGKELLKLIAEQYARPEYQIRFSWRPGSVAFWDNRAAVHYAVRNYGDYPRVLERVLIADEKLWSDL
ncbi:MAG TPA: TauD/TfdA family dioxygenase [Polyangiaceae bacterium]|jgi:alpha-ketoglutarate-dependent taurine dioxygenase|nr:TauD/TfdA family dioxygenase [Polyangiaceae bacterium]